ncbi:MAG: NAD-dependent protein deacetylase [Proteobacteria bacterium]|nr:MAG: NAD-dependent protein deacetylase [Pseudomonadota bacterium]
MNGTSRPRYTGNPPDQLVSFFAAHPRLLVLTGAGVSTGSGIPDYRDLDGQWKRKQPVQYQKFLRSAAVRKRYWARSLVGWSWFATAQPNVTHHALAELERRGHVHHLITQNIDRLHQGAGSARVIDLHGRLDTVVCLDCGTESARAAFQATLEERNPGFIQQTAAIAPDGDADLETVEFGDFEIPGCAHCGGLIKPHVVFFGEAVPRARVEQALALLNEADALLVVGSSLMVFSGYRFARAAAAAGKPIAAINLGRTRADDLLDIKIEARCDTTLTTLCERLA